MLSTAAIKYDGETNKREEVIAVVSLLGDYFVAL